MMSLINKIPVVNGHIILGDGLSVDFVSFQQMFGEATTFQELLDIDGNEKGYADYFQKLRTEGVI